MSPAPVEPINDAIFSPMPKFDPRAVPVFSIDVDLPAVAPTQLTAAALRIRFGAPPIWEPEVRVEPLFADRIPAAAAVLIPIVLRDEPMVLLTRRTMHLSTHSGQVAFPGGRVDEGDASVAAAALREAYEEVGLSAHFIEVLGNLPTYTTGTSFIVTPVVALVQPGFELALNAYEVAESFEIPLAFLMNPAHHQRHRMAWDSANGRREQREWFSMPYQDGCHERYVWGATAGMLRNLYRFLSA